MKRSIAEAYLCSIMARRKNPLGTLQLRFSGNRLISAYLGDLVNSGLYGRTPSEAIERLVSQGIERLIGTGALRRRSAVLPVGDQGSPEAT